VLHLDAADTDQTDGYPARAFWNFVSNYSVGEEFMAYGFPVEGPDPVPEPSMTVPRLFRGHYQRFLEHSSHLGYK
jgi:hypothetical protein